MTTNRQLTDAALEAALARYAGRVSATGLQAGIMADVAATEQARRPLLAPPSWLARPAAPGRLAAIPTVAWLLLLAGLLLGLVVGGLAGGPWWDPDRAVVVGPSPAATVNPAVATILATTKSKPLPAQAACPPGSNPDIPGPPDQARPSEIGPMAFDRHAGRLVASADDRIWTYDVCGNTWNRLPSTQAPRFSEDPADWFVYDADSDRTVAFTASGQFWSYDLAAEAWTKAGSFPGIRRGWGEGAWSTAAVYHDPSGLIVVYDGATMWAYDVEAGTLVEIPQRPDPARPVGPGIPADPLAAGIESAHYDPSGGVAIGYDPRADLLVAVVRSARPGGPSTPRPRDATWTLDPGSGTWRLESSASTPVVGYLGAAGSPSAYDEVSGLTLFHLSYNLAAFDARQRAWGAHTFVGGIAKLGVTWCSSSPYYDPLNGRIVCLGGEMYRGVGPEDETGVSAFSPTTGEWRWLLDPRPSSEPSP